MRDPSGSDLLTHILKPLTPSRPPSLLHDRSRDGKALVDNPPKGGYHLWFGVKEILEEATVVEGRWIGIALPILTKFGAPIVWFTMIELLSVIV